MERLEALRILLQEQELDALLVTGVANRRYLSGFSGSNGTLLVSGSTTLLISDFRYRVQAAREAPTWALQEVSAEQPMAKLVALAADEQSLTTIGVEADHLSLATHTGLRAALDKQFGERPAPALKHVEGLVEGLREVKDQQELTLLRQAIAITDAALGAVLPALRPEHSEQQAAWMLETALREHGAEAVSFPIIVAAGPNAALPHAQPGDEPLGTGRPIVIDMGGRFRGYHADLTRTVVLGEPDARFWQVYETVLAAQQQAIAAIRPGMSGIEADALARDLIGEAGFGEHFGHGLGHGVGLAIHEGPRLGRTGKQLLRTGNVFSIEPGIYIEGWGGIRIEDLVFLGDDGPQVLSQTPKLSR